MDPIGVDLTQKSIDLISQFDFRSTKIQPELELNFGSTSFWINIVKVSAQINLIPNPNRSTQLIISGFRMGSGLISIMKTS